MSALALAEDTKSQLVKKIAPRQEIPTMNPNPRRPRRRRQAGFSLVELMVVIAIIGILASVVLVAVTSRVGQARKTAVLTDFANLKKAIQMFKIDNGFYPDSLQDLVEPPPNANNWSSDGYLDPPQIPSDPWGNEYVYRRTSGGRNPYELISYGADGVDGGEEEAADITLEDLNRGSKNQ